jgi:phosphoenolpyruvate carboxykinase (GTP)
LNFKYENLYFKKAGVLIYILFHYFLMNHENKRRFNEGSDIKSELKSWVTNVANQCNAKNIYWCDGSKQEYNRICELLVEKGTFIRLNKEKHPNSFACFTDTSDVARVEDKTFINSRRKDDAGPTNNWMEPNAMKQILNGLMDGAMSGRTLYVIPFCMGPVGSAYARYGVQLTDSEYVVVNMHIMTRMGENIYPYLKRNFYVKCLHTVGAPLNPTEKDSKWPNNATTK